jgi:hypothetical protein
MGTHMKTTLELSKTLLVQAKAHATRERTTLRALVEEGLRRVLGEARQRRPFKLSDGSFRGKGRQPEFQNADFGRIRDAAYEDHGA